MQSPSLPEPIVDPKRHSLHYIVSLKPFPLEQLSKGRNPVYSEHSEQFNRQLQREW
jgi:hypothetical protein